MPVFSWLHFSDIHVGMNVQGWVWNSIKHAVFSDIRELHRALGAWDFVIFSGDLVQSGNPEEYQKLNQVLSDIWNVFRELGFNPSIFCIPGNHDLVRPGDLEPELLALRSWWSNEKLRTSFWKSEGAPYRIAINKYFFNFRSWLENLEETVSIPVLKCCSGTLAGDQSTIFEKNGLTLGIIGLNSAWLHLHNDAKGSLDIAPEQLFSVTENDPTSWCLKNNLNLLVTHHPVDWLHSASQKTFLETIDPSGRFTAHLFGHMHDPACGSLSKGGSAKKLSIQAASLFGLENSADGAIRLHGYSLNGIELHDDGTGTLSHWPRKDRYVQDGTRVVGPDHGYLLSFDQRIKETISWNKAKTSAQSSDISIAAKKHVECLEEHTALNDLNSDSLDVLSSIRLMLPPGVPHLTVRRIQQEASINALNEKRCFWLVSDWGMAEDGFIWSLRKNKNEDYAELYALDAIDYKSISSFQSDIKKITSTTFEKICTSLSNFGAAYLIFEDIPDDAVTSPDHIDTIVKIASIALEYCPQLRIILKSRKPPITNIFHTIELTPLDLPDTRSYIRDHPNGGHLYDDIESVTKIFRHTDGLPTVIDTTLKSLEVVSLNDLSIMSSDVSGNVCALVSEQEPLKRSILELGDSEDPLLQRSYLLLKALAMFPQGEQLTRIKHFHHNAPFFPSHAQELTNRRFAYSVDSEGLVNSATQTKTLIVSRVVREVVVDFLNPGQFKDLNRRAANMYFGPNWLEGKFKPQATLRFDKPGRSNSEITNARIVAQRIAVDAANSNDARKIENALSLSLFHGKSLEKGSYYRAAFEFFEDIIKVFENLLEEDKLAFLQLNCAKVLRMADVTDCHEKAKQILNDLPLNLFDKSTRQSALLSLALCHKALGENEDAVQIASQVVKLDPRGNVALQGKWIILDLSNDNDRGQKLLELESLARKKNAHVVANNIALSRAKHQQSIQQQETLETVIDTSNKSGDYYTAVRGMLDLAELLDDELIDREKNRLIKAYHYLYSQGFTNLFNRCHNQLWRIFLHREEIDNLLQLFMYSSLAWRLRDNAASETSAIENLLAILGNLQKPAAPIKI